MKQSTEWIIAKLFENENWILHIGNNDQIKKKEEEIESHHKIEQKSLLIIDIFVCYATLAWEKIYGKAKSTHDKSEDE